LLSPRERAPKRRAAAVQIEDATAM